MEMRIENIGIRSCGKKDLDTSQKIVQKMLYLSQGYSKRNCLQNKSNKQHQEED